MDKQKWSLVGSAGLGAGVGAGLMYLLDPQVGRSRRALARDKSVSALKQGGKAAAKTSRRLGDKTKGLVARTGSKLRDSDLASDLGDHLGNNGQKLLKKVRKVIHATVSHPSAIDPILEAGRVHLHGLVLASEVARLLAALQAVEGINGVENRLELHESPQDLAAFRKGRRWVGPATRVLTGTTGSALALAGLRKRNSLGVALGAVGLGLLAHGLANPDVKQLAGRLHLAKNGRARNGGASMEETAHAEPVSDLGHQLEDAYQTVS